ncbi:hypothetical protein BG004_003274 [Podila humilis]|nr:hypothetical protein BG004_003274 [Podila humilis]
MPKKKKGTVRSITEGLDLGNKQRAMAQVIERLESLTDKSGREVSELFMTLPDQDEYPDYYLAIKHPVAFETIKTRLDQGHYTNSHIKQFGKDLKTLVSNAKSYNRHGSTIYKDAVTLEKSIEEVLPVLYSEKAVLPPEPFSMVFCARVWKSIRSLKDESGRLVSELFWKLPDRDEYPDYYQEIARPIALDGIKKKIDENGYNSLKEFEDDFTLMFSNAQQYNTEGSGVYLDAEELRELFRKLTGKEQVKPPRRPNSAANASPTKRQKNLSAFVHLGETYRIGEFIHIRSNLDSSNKVVGLIVSLWENSGQHGFDATWFLRPGQFEHPYASQFWEAEVVKAIGSHEHLETDVIDKCFVLYPSVYVKGRPKQWKEGQSIYLCDQRFNEKKQTVTKIKNWPSVFPKGFVPDEIKLDLFPQPLVLAKTPCVSKATRPFKAEPDEPTSSGQSTPSDIQKASTPSLTPTTPTPVTSTARKRKSAQIQKQSSPAYTPPTQQRGTVRCNYSNFATGTPCSRTFPSVQELQRHVGEEHAMAQSTPAQTMVKRGRPMKDVLTDSAGSSPQPQDIPIKSMHPQAAPDISQYSPQGVTTTFDAARRPNSLNSSVYPASTFYPSHPQPPTGYQNMQYTHPQHISNGTMAYHSTFAQQQQSFVGDPRSQGYGQPQPTAYNQTYSQSYAGQHQRGYTQYPPYDQSQVQQRYSAPTTYTGTSYHAAANPYQTTQQHQQYPHQTQSYSQSYHPTPSHPNTHAMASTDHSGLSQYTYAQNNNTGSQRPLTETSSRQPGSYQPTTMQFPPLSSSNIGAAYPHSAARPQQGPPGSHTYQSQVVVQSQTMSTPLASGSATTQQYHHNQMHQQPYQQQHVRTQSGSSVSLAPPMMNPARTMAMEGAGLGLTGVTISDHARVTPPVSSMDNTHRVHSSSVVTSSEGMFGYGNSATSNYSNSNYSNSNNYSNHNKNSSSGIAGKSHNDQMGWNGGSNGNSVQDLGSMAHNPDNFAKRRKQELAVGPVVSSNGVGSVTSIIEGGAMDSYGHTNANNNSSNGNSSSNTNNGTMIAGSQQQQNLGHGHSFSTSSMESVVHGHKTGSHP